MEFFQLPDGNVAGFDNPTDAPAGATAITAEQYAQIANAPTVSQVQAQLRADCNTAIESSFTSSALGTLNTYPSDQTTQRNQTFAAASPTGGGLWCSASAAALTPHTQAQAQQVCADFIAWVNKCQAQLVTLLAQAQTSTSVAWTNP